MRAVKVRFYGVKPKHHLPTLPITTIMITTTEKTYAN